ncbi:putative M18 family aminopeptidase 2 [Sinobacterium norvegicum]|uniref:M18 family aminopeptidase n=2 Tax=Sinobacterium norvegicum TaxID=1641715 RepID=A0ABM9AB08_9GAMM|nr:M18 family aminopeptidase [Sinobacterium norvegicum]CAH0990400.1 putative M18 family aminopeptidase 2 [Sinobacterium norvegicum]
MDIQQFNRGLLSFIDASPTPFHAVSTMVATLTKAGFVRLREGDSWDLVAGERYYLCRNDSSIIAFVCGKQSILDHGVRMVGAHTDSPCLRVKPNPDMLEKGYLQLGVEIYGGALLNPWFDRDLSLAGRVSLTNDKGELISVMIDFENPIAVIPSLAIHLDREANTNRTVNKQTDMPPMLAIVDGDELNFNDIVIAQIERQHSDVSVSKILDWELSFYDTQPSAMTGLRQQFVSAARLDNLLSCYTGLQALLQADGEMTSILVCNDHEEVGSSSAAGAQGPMLKHLLQRMCQTTEDFARVIERSMMISADNAHAIHPNFIAKHDGNHGPQINQGPVIKINANQRYATNSETAALYRYLSDQVDVPVQSFVVRSDMGCGSTIGPITATELGVRTIDIGVPTFAMHSIRELAGSEDAFGLHKVCWQFYNTSDLPWC